MRLHAFAIAAVHECKTAIAATTIARVHACTIAIVHACTMAIVHACTIAILHACTIDIVHACTISHRASVPSLLRRGVWGAKPPRAAGGFDGPQAPQLPEEMFRLIPFNSVRFV